jgi:hypothetical protein
MSKTSLCSHLEPTDRIECKTSFSPSRPEGYPVLGVGDLSIFPTAQQLRAIHRAIEQWLTEEATRNGLGAGI